MVQIVEVPGHGEVEFPDGMSDADIAAVIKKQGAPAAGNPATPNYQSGKQNRTLADDVTAGEREVLQGMTFGFGDEMQAALATPGIYALKNLATNDKMGIGDAYDLALSKSRAGMPEFQADHPVMSPLLQIAGGVTTGGLSAKALKALAPEASAGLADFAAAHPYLASLGLGGGTGALYGFGTGEGGFENRGENAVLGGAVGSVAGPGATYMGRNVVGPMATRARSALSDLIDRFSGKADDIAAVPAPVSLGGVSDAPLEDTKPVSDLANLVTQKGNVINLPAGVQDMDTKKLRLQEDARQGVLGADAEATQRKIDQDVVDQTKSVVQSTVGKTTSDNGDDMLYKGIASFKKHAKEQKARAGKMMEERNQKIADASIYRGYTHNTLTKSVEEVLDDPQNAVTLSTVPDSPIHRYAKVLNALTAPAEDGKFQTPLDFKKLQGWSSSLSEYARANAGSPDATIANKMVGKYNEWLDNISRDAIKEGDKDVGEQILAANAKYREFKQKFGTNDYSGESGILEDIIQKDAQTPRQVTNTVFGSGITSKDVTGQIVGRMMKALPDDAAREGLKNDFRAGLLLRAYKDSQNADGSLKLGTLANKITDIMENDVYKDHLSTPEHDKVLKGLAADLSQYMRATNDKTVRSTSGTGGTVARLFQGILRNPAVRAATAGQSENLNALVQNAAKAKDRASLKKIEAEFFNKFSEAMDAKSTLYGGLAGGTLAGANTQQ